MLFNQGNFLKYYFCHMGFKALNRKPCYAFSSFYREYGDKSYPPTLAPSVTEPAEKESADDEEEMEEKEPVSSFSTDPLQHVDIGDLSLKEQDSCAILMGKEEHNENKAAETAEDDNTEVQQEAEDSRTPQGTSVYKWNQTMHLLFAEAGTHDLSYSAFQRALCENRGRDGSVWPGKGSERTEYYIQKERLLTAYLFFSSLQSKWMHCLASAFFML